MSDQRDEVERIKRIRDRQLQLRDPRARDREVQHKVASRYRRDRITLGSAIRDLSGKWLGTIIGGLCGVLIAIAFHLLVQSEDDWVSWASYVIVLAGLALGRLAGAALDWRDEDHEALVRRR
jgi:hypothetical protein